MQHSFFKKTVVLFLLAFSILSGAACGGSDSTTSGSGTGNAVSGSGK